MAHIVRRETTIKCEKRADRSEAALGTRTVEHEPRGV